MKRGVLSREGSLDKEGTIYGGVGSIYRGGGDINGEGVINREGGDS